MREEGVYDLVAGRKAVKEEEGKNNGSGGNKEEAEDCTCVAF